jgi:para-aminobenzoate synthetase / 4-amino-4-deoxychorismate lyase
MTKVIFGPLSDTTKGWSLLLESPRKTFSTNQLGEVTSILHTLESEARNGSWVTLMLSYEAAPAFDSHFRTHESKDFPLLWAAVFDRTSTTPELHQKNYELGSWQPRISREEYSAAVAQIRELIARGDTYQVNYTFPMTASFQGDALSWYRDLCNAQRADYCVYVEIENYTVLSLSPELFFERTGDRMKTRPMKGTSKRGRWSAEDEEQSALLSASSKQRAENVMIVDLLRNDLGKIAVPGSVEVSELFQVERYPTLWQMTSTIQSTLKPHTQLTEVMGALFPCGSITGAPKIRTMEIIHDLERHPRHAYTGTIGLIKPGGDCTFNVAIRTVLLNSRTGIATFGTGGGITYGSLAESEYAECLLKSSFLAVRPSHYELLESMLLEDGEYFLLEKHLERLHSSAKYFDFEYDEAAIRQRLFGVCENHNTGKWKVRLIIGRAREVKIESLPLDDSSNAPLRVGLASAPVDSNDPSLYHKLTTNLGRYRGQMGAHSNWEDVILWNERGEITESSIANIVLRVGDRLVTPPVSSGLLPGTFRQALLEEGRICEGVITLNQIKAADEFFLINSVRKWQSARLENQSPDVPEKDKQIA